MLQQLQSLSFFQTAILIVICIVLVLVIWLQVLEIENEKMTNENL
jgi:hypothetical protein